MICTAMVVRSFLRGHSDVFRTLWLDTYLLSIVSRYMGLVPPFAESHLRFNVSHSDDVAVYAFSREREIGVDVEAVREMPHTDDIAGRFFSAREVRTYRPLDSRDKPCGFVNCWTRKEAFIKVIGDGLSHPLDSFDVSLVPGESSRILRHGNVSGDGCGWMLSSMDLLPADYVGAIAFEEPAQCPAAAAIAQPPDSFPIRIRAD